MPDPQGPQRPVLHTLTEPAGSSEASPPPSGPRHRNTGRPDTDAGMRALHSPAEWLRWFGRTGRRLVVLAVGVAILGAGVAMLALPGPGLLVILVGLAVLATEFAWAERALDRTTVRAASAASKVSGSRSGRAALAASGLGMIVGGAIAASFVDGFRVIGLSVAFAGVVGLATLLPPVQRWIEARTATTDSDDSTTAHTRDHEPATPTPPSPRDTAGTTGTAAPHPISPTTQNGATS